MSKLNELVKIAQHAVSKAAFVDPATVAGGGMGGGMPPGGDPSAMGMDPSMMGGAPPGGAPAGDPAAAGAPPAGGGGDPALSAKLDQMMQMLSSGGGAGGAGAGQLKPKIDVNVALMQLSKMVARIADSLGVTIPAAEMIATPQDLAGMAQQQQAGGAAPPGGGGGGGGAPQSSIPPIAPIQGASPALAGSGGGAGGEKSSLFIDGEPAELPIVSLGNKAAALAAILEQRRAQG